MSHSKEVRLAGSVLDRSRHVCAFFNTKEEEYRILLPFIKEGFEQGDKGPRHDGAAGAADSMIRLLSAACRMSASELRIG